MSVVWILRIAVFGEFLGHGVLGIQGNPLWVGWIATVTGFSLSFTTALLTIGGIVDILLAFAILIRPMRWMLLVAIVIAFFANLLGPLAGEQIWEFVASLPNIAAPLVLLLLLPKTEKADQEKVE